MELVPLLLVVVVIVAGSLLWWRLEAGRREALAARCLARGWTYQHRADEWVGRLRGPFPLFDRGRARTCTDVITVPDLALGRPATLLSYRYTTGSGKSSTTHRVAVGLVALPVPLGELRLGSEGLMSRLASSVGFRDVEVESVEFNRRFRVAARDRVHAFDLLHPQMIEFLLAQPFDAVEVAGGYLLVHRSGHWRPEEHDAVLAVLARFCELVPDYVWRKHGLVA
jgi:hypothetical protein